MTCSIRCLSTNKQTCNNTHHNTFLAISECQQTQHNNAPQRFPCGTRACQQTYKQSILLSMHEMQMHLCFNCYTGILGHLRPWKPWTLETLDLGTMSPETLDPEPLMGLHHALYCAHGMGTHACTHLSASLTHCTHAAYGLAAA